MIEFVVYSFAFVLVPIFGETLFAKLPEQTQDKIFRAFHFD